MGQTAKSNLSLVGVVILLCAMLIGMGMLLGSGNVLAVDLAAQETAEESAPPVAAEKAPAVELLNDLHAVRIGSVIVFGIQMRITEVASAVSGQENLLADTRQPLQHRHRSAAFRSRSRSAQTGSPAADHNDPPAHAVTGFLS